MASGTQQHVPTPSPNNFTNCQSSSSGSGGMNFGAGCLFWSSHTQFDPKKVFEELNKCFLDCDANCNICTNFIFALTQHIRASHSKPETEIGGQSQIFETTGQDSCATASSEAEVEEHPRNINEDEILIIDLEEEETSEMLLSSPNETPISDEVENTENPLFPIPMDETVSEPQAPNELQLQLIPCRFCRNKFSYNTLKSHVESYHPEKLVNINIYHCRVCGIDTTFMRPATVHQHFREFHPGEMFYFCKLCKQGVPRVDHWKQCPTRKPRFQCVICDRVFVRKGFLNTHVADCHPEESAKLLPDCEICGRLFFSEEKLTEHKREIHPYSSSGTNENDPTPDSIIQFQTELQPQRYEKEKLKRFECSTCEKRFFKSESLFHHFENKHKGNVDQEHSYLCTVCDKEFADAIKMLLHRQKVHPGVRNCKFPKQSTSTVKIDKPKRKYPRRKKVSAL